MERGLAFLQRDVFGLDALGVGDLADVHEVFLREGTPVAAGNVEFVRCLVRDAVQEIDDGERGLAACREGFHDGGGAGHAVARGEDFLSAGAGEIGVGDFEAALGGGEAFGHHGALADGGDHGVGLELELGAGDQDRGTASGGVGFAELHAGAGEREGAVGILREGGGRGEEFELDAFLHGLVDFDGLRGHLVTGAAVHDGHVAAEAERGAGAVDGGVAAADHDGATGVRAVLPVLAGDVAEPLDALLGGFLAVDAHGAGGPGADREDHGVEVLFELFDREVLAELLAGADFDAAHLAEVREFLAERVLRQTEFRDAVAEHAARFGHLFEEERGDALEAEIVCGGEARGTRADDGDALAVEGGQVFHVGVVVHVGGEALHVVDGYGLASDVAAAVAFAETGADAADGHRQRDALLDDLKSLFEVAVAAGADIFLDGGVGGAGERAGRFAVAGVLGDEQGEGGAAHVLHFVGGGVDLLSGRGAGGAGGEELPGLAVLDDTDEAAGGLGDFLVVAERGDLHADAGGGLQDGLARLSGDLTAVDFEDDI